MYCRKCGAEIADDVRFCNRCGAPTSPEEEVAPPPSVAPVDDQTPAASEPSSERSPVVLAIVGVVVCLFFGILFIGGVEGDDEWAAEIGAAVLDAADSQDPTTRDYALSLVRSSHSGTYNIAQICDIWEGVYVRWIYVNDPQGAEYFSPASRTVNIGLKGDCDDFAILMAALIEAIGGDTRVVLASDYLEDGHAFSEVYVGDEYRDLRDAAEYISERYGCETIWYQKSTGYFGSDEYWINLDWWNEHPGGDYFQFEDALAVDVSDGETTEITDGGEIRSVRCWSGY